VISGTSCGSSSRASGNATSTRSCRAISASSSETSSPYAALEVDRLDRPCGGDLGRQRGCPRGNGVELEAQAGIPREPVAVRVDGGSPRPKEVTKRKGRGCSSRTSCSAQPAWRRARSSAAAVRPAAVLPRGLPHGGVGDCSSVARCSQKRSSVHPPASGSEGRASRSSGKGRYPRPGRLSRLRAGGSASWWVSRRTADRPPAARTRRPRRRARAPPVAATAPRRPAARRSVRLLVGVW
jgi:hypothetical protein